MERNNAICTRRCRFSHIKEYVVDSKGAVVVCPSGGYCNRAVHEGETMGEHGLGLAPEVPYVSKWAEDLDRWLTYKEWK